MPSGSMGLTGKESAGRSNRPAHVLRYSEGYLSRETPLMLSKLEAWGT